MTKEKLKKIAFWAACVLIPLGVVYGIYSSYYEDTDDAFLETDIVPISARVSGHIKSVEVNDNQSMKQGDLLVKLDPADFEARLNQAKAELAAAEAVAQRAAADLVRYVPLLKKDEISKQKYDFAKAEADEAKADVDAAKARKDQAELNLSYTEVTAPFDGKVTKKTAEIGSYVVAGQPLMAIVSPNLWVIANFKETQIKKMKPGQPVSILVDTVGHSFKGHVDSIQSGSGVRYSLFPPENATGNYIKVIQRVPVKIIFDEPLPELAKLGPGLSVVPRVKVR